MLSPRPKPILLTLTVLLAACGAPDSATNAADTKFPGITGHLEQAALGEASGVAMSRRNPDVIWLINDNGNGAVLFAARRDGTHVAALPVEGATNVDWEDLASFELDGEPWLLIGDIGDNDSRHEDRVLYALQEPDLDAKPPQARVAWEIRYRYSGGPRDAEAMAVDADSGEVLVLSKRDLPPELYSLPLRPGANTEMLTAQLAARLDTLPPPTAADLEKSRSTDPDIFVWHWQPTAMDISPDGTTIAILTYRDAYVYSRAGQESWQDMFLRMPYALGQPVVPEAEAMCFVDERQLLITAEGEHAAIQTLSITADR
jgi:hypothetical protein